MRKGEIVLEDSQIVELYWQKNADAISETANKYGAYCFAIADNILHCAEDSEECVNDTWLHTWNAIPPQKPNVFRMFLAKITRNLSFNRFNARCVEKRGGGEIILVLDELRECVAGGSDVEAAYEATELEQCICRFVRTLLCDRGGSLLAGCRRSCTFRSHSANSRLYRLTTASALR